MKAVLLAGGLGTRLYPVTLDTPKALIPVRGKPLLEHTLDLLRTAGVTEIYLSIGHLAEQIQAYCENNVHDLNVHYLVETERLGTGGWLHNMPRLEENFLVLNQDNLFDLPFQELIDFHAQKGAAATIALTRVEDPSAFGIVELEENRILRFVEKPSREEAPSDLANGGYYVFSPRVFDFLPEQKAFSLERDLFPVLAEHKLLFGFPSDALWFDTGTFDRWKSVIQRWNV